MSAKMESSISKTIAKELIAEYLKFNPDIERPADCEQKAMLRRKIEQKRAERDALQRMIESLTSVNMGLQNGAENSTIQSAIMRETREIVGALVTEDKKIQQRQPTVAATDVLQVQNRMLEERFEETVRYQEHVLATIRRSRVFLMLEHTKEECRKAREELENTQREIELAEQKNKKEDQEMFDSFIEQAIQIGEEQERLEQKQAQLDAWKRRRETLLQGTMNFGDGKPVAHMAEIAHVPAATVQCATETQRADEDDYREDQMGLKFCNIIEDFPIGSTFKNPNDFPDILGRIRSPKRKDIMAKDQQATAEGKENAPYLTRSSIKRRNSVVATREEVTVSLPAPSPKRKKIKSLNARQPQELPTISEINDRPCALNEQQIEEGKDGAAKRTLFVGKSSGTTSDNVKSQSKAKSVPQTVPKTPAVKVQEKSLGKRARFKSPKCIDVCETLADNSQVKPKVKASKRAPVDETDPCPNAMNIFKTPQSTLSVVLQKLPAQNQTCKQTQPPQTTGEGSEPQTSKNLRENQILPLKKCARNSSTSAGQAPAVDGNTDKACCDPLNPAQSSSSHGSLDFGLQSSSIEFDVDVFTSTMDVDFQDTDLDFLTNKPPAASPSKAKKAKKAKKGEEADSFSFDIEAQDSNDSIDQSVNDLF